MQQGFDRFLAPIGTTIRRMLRVGCVSCVQNLWAGVNWRHGRDDPLPQGNKKERKERWTRKQRKEREKTRKKTKKARNERRERRASWKRRKKPKHSLPTWMHSMNRFEISIMGNNVRASSPHVNAAFVKTSHVYTVYAAKSCIRKQEKIRHWKLTPHSWCQQAWKSAKAPFPNDFKMFPIYDIYAQL